MYDKMVAHPQPAEYAMPHDDHSAKWRSFLEGQSRAALIELARGLGVPGVSRLSKGAMVEALLATPNLRTALPLPRTIAAAGRTAPDSHALLEACLQYAVHDRRAFVAPAIPRRRLEAAVAAFRLPLNERVLALFDNTPGGGGQFGIVIGAGGLYWRNLRTRTGDHARGALSWPALRRTALQVDEDLGDVYAGACRINAQRLSLQNFLAFMQKIQGSVPHPSHAVTATPVITCGMEQAHAAMTRKALAPEAAGLLAALLQLGQDRPDEIQVCSDEIARALHLPEAGWSRAMEAARLEPSPVIHAKGCIGSPSAHAVLWECLIALQEAPPGDARAHAGLERLASACGILRSEWARTRDTSLRQDQLPVPWLNVRDYAGLHPDQRGSESRNRPQQRRSLLPPRALVPLARALVFLGMGRSLPVARRVIQTPAGTARTVSIVERAAGSVSTRTEFSFEPLGGSGSRLCLAVSGYLSADSESTIDWAPLRHFAVGAECYAVRWESQAVRGLSNQLLNVSLRSAGRALVRQVTRQPVAVVSPGAALPSLVIEYAHSIDKSWREALDSSDATAQQLAQHLREGVPRGRPVSLVGFSLGSRVVFRALEELARTRDQGLVSEVILLGGAFSASDDRWRSVRSVVSGRLVNAYCKTDYVLRYLYRAAEWEKQIAGLLPTQAAGVEDIDLTDLAQGHFGYRRHLQRIMERIFGHGA